MACAVWLYVWELTILALHPFPTSVWCGGCGSRSLGSVFDDKLFNGLLLSGGRIDGIGGMFPLYLYIILRLGFGLLELVYNNQKCGIIVPNLTKKHRFGTIIQCFLDFLS